MDVYELAGIAYDHFEMATRDDGETYDRLKDGAPEWLRELVYDAHGDFLPDDWRYACIRSALGFIHDNESEESGEFADDAVDVYNAARTAWLASNLNRAAYVDEATAEFGPADSVFDALGQGQYMEASEVFGSVLRSLETRMEEIESTEDES